MRLQNRFANVFGRNESGQNEIVQQNEFGWNESAQNEFGQTKGTAFFSYFNKEITVICREGVSSEYAKKCLGYLAEVDDVLMLQICKYAENFLKDTLENTSVGEAGDEEAFPYDGLLDLLRYIHFEALYIEEPPESVSGVAETFVLNLAGGCDWWEDEGLQCLVRDREVIYLGYFEDLSVWGDYSKRYIGNYVLYESYHKRLLRYKQNMGTNAVVGQSRTQDFYDYWNGKGSLIRQKITNFVNYISSKENITFGEAVIALEDTYLYQLMKDYPQLLEEGTEFWYQCYDVEKETDDGELMRYICENCERDLF